MTLEMENQSKEMIKSIKDNKETHNLSKLLEDTKMHEVKILDYINKEIKNLESKEVYMIFNNNDALMNVVGEMEEKDGRILIHFYDQS